MSEKLLRVYKKFYIDEIKAHLLIYGDLGGSCAACQKMDIKLDTAHCPECKTEFKFIAFRNPRVHMPKILKLSEERPQVAIVDYEDFHRLTGEQKAREFLK
ncbi:MAG: hypothetical protein HZA29_01610 [Candidatus Omnitrophica bacterium]|nr:hypothetical protein [Candidatus Omnitrophota bacterium]